MFDNTLANRNAGRCVSQRFALNQATQKPELVNWLHRGITDSDYSLAGAAAAGAGAAAGSAAGAVATGAGAGVSGVLRDSSF